MSRLKMVFAVVAVAFLMTGCMKSKTHIRGFTYKIDANLEYHCKKAWTKHEVDTEAIKKLMEGILKEIGREIVSSLNEEDKQKKVLAACEKFLSDKKTQISR